ncbi:MAG: choice-of-anchor H family protein [Melioribacteraceae bacterium]|nr:choice-of-anchor H family protein [Melioribacteraceae bacterium]
MKNFIILLSLLGIVVSMLSCNTVEEEPNYTYKIDSVWWSDVIDGNSDGYSQFERLNFIVHLKENTSQNISGRVYYKLREASNFSFYAFSKDKRVIGENEDNYLFVSIGSPNKELQRGVYDFSIEVFQTNQSDIKAEPDSLQLITLSSKKFEKSENDNTFTLNISWVDKYDRTGNGYFRSASLVIDANNNESVTRNLDAKIYYKRSEDSDFQLYTERLNFEIYGNSDNDTIIIPVGSPNTMLEYGEYDFRVDLFEAGKDNLLAFEDMENPLLSKQKFESEDEDSYYYTISNVWWSDSTDMDSDSFTSLRKLHYDVDVDKNETRTLFAKVYMRLYEESPTDSSDYDILYDSTSNFTITGSNVNDSYFSWIGNNTTALDSSKYDILISVFDADVVDTTQSAVASLSGFTETILNEQSFETASQDSL